MQLRTDIVRLTLVATLTSASAVQAIGDPPGLPSEGPQRRILHLLQDADGRVYTTHHTFDVETGQVSALPSKQFVTDQELQMLRELGVQRNTEIMIHPEDEFYRIGAKSAKPELKSSGSCLLAGAPYYGAISFWTVSGTHYGADVQSNSSNRGAGESTH